MGEPSVVSEGRVPPPFRIDLPGMFHISVLCKESRESVVKRLVKGYVFLVQMSYLVFPDIPAIFLQRGVIVVERPVFLVYENAVNLAAAVRKDFSRTPVGTGHISEHIHT